MLRRPVAAARSNSVARGWTVSGASRSRRSVVPSVQVRASRRVPSTRNRTPSVPWAPGGRPVPRLVTLIGVLVGNPTVSGPASAIEARNGASAACSVSSSRPRPSTRSRAADRAGGSVIPGGESVVGPGSAPGPAPRSVPSEASRAGSAPARAGPSVAVTVPTMPLRRAPDPHGLAGVPRSAGGQEAGRERHTRGRRAGSRRVGRLVAISCADPAPCRCESERQWPAGPQKPATPASDKGPAAPGPCWRAPPPRHRRAVVGAGAGGQAAYSESRRSKNSR